MDFRLVNAVVQMRVNSQPLAYAIDRESININRFMSNFGQLSINMQFKGMERVGQLMQGLVTGTTRYASNIGKAGAQWARVRREQNRTYHDQNVQAAHSARDRARAAMDRARERHNDNRYNNYERLSHATTSAQRAIAGSHRKLPAAYAAVQAYQTLRPQRNAVIQGAANARAGRDAVAMARFAAKQASLQSIIGKHTNPAMSPAAIQAAADQRAQAKHARDRHHIKANLADVYRTQNRRMAAAERRHQAQAMGNADYQDVVDSVAQARSRGSRLAARAHGANNRQLADSLTGNKAKHDAALQRSQEAVAKATTDLAKANQDLAATIQKNRDEATRAVTAWDRRLATSRRAALAGQATWHDHNRLVADRNADLQGLMSRINRSNTRSQGRVDTATQAHTTAQGQHATSQHSARIAVLQRGLLATGQYAALAATHMLSFLDSVVRTINPLGLIGKAIDGVIGMFGHLLNVGKNVLAFLADWTMKAGIAAMAVAGLSLKAAGDQEAAMVNIGRVADISGKSLDSLRDKLLDLAKHSSGALLKEINDIAEFGARLGIGDGLGGDEKSGAIARFTKDVSKLRMALDDIPADEAATKIVRILKVFGESPEAIPNFASALVKLDNVSTATGRDILELTRRLSGITSAMGMLPEDVMAIATSMRDVGIEVHVGGTALQQLFLAMGARSKDFSKVLKINQKDLLHAMDTSPVDALRMVLGQLSRYKPTAQMQILTKLHMQGRQSASTIFQLSKAFGVLDRNIGIARGEWQTLEATEEAVERRSQTAWAMLVNLGNQALVLGENIGRKLLPAFKQLIKFLVDVTQKLSGWFDQIGGDVDAFMEKVVKGMQIVRGALANLPRTLELLQRTFMLLWEGVEDGFVGMGPKIMASLGEILIQIKDLFLSILPELVDIGMFLGRSIGEAIGDGIRMAFGENNWLANMLPKTEKQKLKEDIAAKKNELKSAQEEHKFNKKSETLFNDNGDIIGEDRSKEKSQKEMDIESTKIAALELDIKRLEDTQAKASELPNIAGFAGKIQRFTTVPGAKAQKELDDRAAARKENFGHIQEEFMGMGQKVADGEAAEAAKKVQDKAERIEKSKVAAIQKSQVNMRYKEVNDIFLESGHAIDVNRVRGNMGMMGKGAIKNTPEFRDNLINMFGKGIKNNNEQIFDPQPNRPGNPRDRPAPKRLAENLERLERMRDNQMVVMEHRKFVKDRVKHGEKGGDEQKRKDSDNAVDAALEFGTDYKEELAGIIRGRRKRQPKVMGGREIPEKGDYKPQFFGLEEFSKHIQTSLFDPKQQSGMNLADEKGAKIKDSNNLFDIAQNSKEQLASLKRIEREGLGTMIA